MPVEFDVVLKDGTVLSYYIPTVLMRGEKEVASNTTILSDWPWTNPYYAVKLSHEPSKIKEIKLHGTGHIADVEPLNDELTLPKKWNWDKHKLRLTIVEKKKKKRAKLKKVNR